MGSAYSRLQREIHQLLLKEDYQPATVKQPEVGYVFCPEHRTGRPEPLYVENEDEARLWLFGPTLLPDISGSQSVEELTKDGIAIATAESTVRPVVIQPITTAFGSTIEARASVTSVPSSDFEPIEVGLGTTTGGADDVCWQLSIRANPHLLVVGLPGMGKTTCLINICRQLSRAGVWPIVFSYHDDIDAELVEELGPLSFVDYDGLGFNPLRVDAPASTAYVDVAGTLRDVFGSIFTDLGDIQLEDLRQAIKQSYDDAGWPTRRVLPSFRAFFDILSKKAKPNTGLLARLRELADYGFFDGTGEKPSLLDFNQPTIVRIHGTTNGMLQSAFSSFVLYSLYKDMFRRGVQSRLTHAIIFDEAHRAARLKLIPQFAKECRKYGLSLILASQEAKDFNLSLYSAVGSYLVLRVTEADARALARMTGASADEKQTVDRLKALERYTALFFTEGLRRPIRTLLAD
jgi:hypothetical protein